MEELNGNSVDVVLGIEMARGMPILEHPVKIEVNFNGRPLETDLYISEQNLAFNTELAWEVEKKELRKVRTNNIPLKVELQMVDNRGCKDRIGLILLSARSANIITRDFQSEIPFKWWKLIGVPTKLKRCYPELYMSLTIRDLAFGEDSESSYLRVSQVFNEHPEPSHLDLHGCTEDIFDDSHNDEGNQRVADTVLHLRGDSELPYLPVSLESDEHTGPFCLDPKDSTEDDREGNQRKHNADTVLDCVEEPLLLPYLPVSHESDEHPEPLCLDPHGRAEDTFDGSHNDDDNERELSADTVGHQLIAIGNAKSKPPLLRLTDRAQQTIPKSEPSGNNPPKSDVSLELPRATQSLRSIRPTLKKAAAAYQQYCFDVRVDNISFRNCFKSRTIGITFKHPKEASEIIANGHISEGNVTLKDARCKIIFISTEDRVHKMINAWPPKLWLTDDTGQHLTEELNIFTPLFTKTSAYLTECKAIGTHDTFANISITICLEEWEFSVYSKQNDFLLSPPILDEYIVIRELCELQTWKDAQTQRAQHTTDLEFLNELVMFQEDWYGGEEIQIEDKLAISAGRCETMTLELQNAMDALDIKSALLEQTEGNMENRIVDKNTFFDSGKIALISTISKLEYENKNLKDTIDDQKVALREIRQTSLTIEQIARILEQIRDFQEKIEGEWKATTHSKETWKKVVREIYDLKSQKETRKEAMQIYSKVKEWI